MTPTTMPLYSLSGIQTKYLGPTNTRGSRIKAQRSDHETGDKTITLPYDHSINLFENHQQAALALIEHYEWHGTYTAASTDRGYIFARATR